MSTLAVVAGVPAPGTTVSKSTLTVLTMDGMVVTTVTPSNVMGVTSMEKLSQVTLATKAGLIDQIDAGQTAVMDSEFALKNVTTAII